MSSLLTSFPSYLFGLLAVVVPIIIHLLSKSKGKPLAVGTLKFFQQVKPVKMTEVKLVDTLLLILRLLMLICAILLVAQLWWQDNDGASNEEFYLITDRWLHHSTIEEKRELSNKLKGNKAYILNGQLSSLSSEQILTWETSKGTDLKFKSKPLWPAINIAHYRLSKEAIFHVYTDNIATNFIGNPVKISQPIQWNILNINQQMLPNIKALPLKVTVVADFDRAHSVLRLQQAFTLLKKELLPKLSFNVIESEQIDHLDKLNSETSISIINDSDWLFYLSSKENSIFLHAAINKGINLFFDAQVQNSKRTNTSFLTEIGVGLEGVKLYKRGEGISIEELLIEAGGNWYFQVQPKWVTNKGVKVLENYTLQTKKGTQSIYQLHSRLELDWLNITEKPQFIRILLSLLLKENTAAQQVINSNERLSFEQIQAFDTIKESISPTEINQHLSLLSYEKQSLTQWLITLLAFFWCCERLLSERLPKINNAKQSNAFAENEYS
jgi:hypothetical protein